MEHQPLEFLIRRHQLYKKFETLLDDIPEKVAEFYEDAALTDEPLVCELLSDIKSIGERYKAMSQDLEDRLVEAMWHHLFQEHGIVKGDLVDVRFPHGAGYRIIVEKCLPPESWNQSTDFYIFGRSALASGKPGKREFWAPMGYAVCTKLERTKLALKRTVAKNEISSHNPEDA